MPQMVHLWLMTALRSRENSATCIFLAISDDIDERTGINKH